MTEREKDERDLTILKEYEVGASVEKLMADHNVTKRYLLKLLREVFNA